VKKYLAFVIALVVLAPYARGMIIEVAVGSRIGGNMEHFEMNENVTGIQEFETQWYNSQSVSCMSRMGFKIMKNGEFVDTVWSEEKEMLPGVSDSFFGYWSPEEKGNYSIRIKIHHCHEIIETEAMNFTVLSVPNPREKIVMETENLPGHKIKVTLSSDEDLKDVAIIPKNTRSDGCSQAKKQT